MSSCVHGFTNSKYCTLCAPKTMKHSRGNYQVRTNNFRNATENVRVNCPKCGKGQMRKFISRTAKNPNRPFSKCSDCGYFEWLDLKAPASNEVPSFSSEASDQSTNEGGEGISLGVGERVPVSVTLVNGDETRTIELAQPVSLELPKIIPLATDDDVSIPNDATNVGTSTSANDLETTRQVGTSSSLAGDTETKIPSFLKVQAPVIALKKEFVPSKYQEDIFTFVKGDNGNAVIEAVAGSGKTTTLVKALEYTDPKAKVGFIAFNKHIADELKDRAPSHVHVSTLHSLGYMNARNALGNSLKVNEWKLYDLWDERIDPFTENNEIKPTAVKLVNLCKATLRVPNQENIDWLVDRYSIDVNGDLDKIYDLTQKLYHVSVNEKETLDYTDMVFWTAQGEFPVTQFDVLFTDESQDFGVMDAQAVLHSVKPNGRVIGVGDRNQSLYGFRGADVDAIPNLISSLNATVLPLSISYRCHKGAIRLAQQLVPQIEWREDAPEGIVKGLDALPNCIPGDMILCRINAPLVAPCFDLIRRGIKASIRGRDIGNGLVQMLKRGEKMAQSSMISNVMGTLSQYVARETVKLRRARKEVRASSLEDSLETLIALSDNCSTVADVRRKIQQVFSDDKASVVFSSVHRAKGLEAKRVFILRPDLMPFPKAEQAWELQQERNVKYVALTRPKEELYFVSAKE